jgi:tripartite-type tricarboxylate transporter receptor subunit TctC
LGGLLFEHRPGIDPDKNPDEWIAKNVKKVSSDKLDDFIRLADEESTSKGITTDKDEKPNEIKDLLKDVPENQIQEFINETAALGDDNSIMN